MAEPGLELVLPATEAARLTRLKAIAPLLRSGHRSVAVEQVWHDTAEGALAAEGLALCERREGRQRRWQLVALRADPPGGAMEPLAEADALDRLGEALPAPLLPVAACVGRLRRVQVDHPEGSVALALLTGRVRSAAGERAVCRVGLAGSAAPAVALAITATLPLAPPAASLPAEALATAGRPVPGRRLGAPALAPELGVSVAFAHIVGHLLGVLLHHAPAAAEGTEPEAVHQMRVALRRLRSAWQIFGAAVACPAVDEAMPALRELGRTLGPARDWDVFATTTLAAVAAGLSDERALQRLGTGAARRRRESYTVLRQYLAGAGFREVAIRLAALAALRPWEAAAAGAEEQGALLAQPLADFGAHALARRLARAEEAGERLAMLTGAELHALRIRLKRLRYTAEFFAPLYPARSGRRFIRRLARLQDRLGRLNDAAVADALLGQLDGGRRSYAAGVVRGFLAAGEARARKRLDRAWRRFRRLDPFWA
ncbi:MAG: CHAD domain-containing protein [Alphaproteobacteria bacterium]|nr:CHAD domain-containing protein [Alphaproteobacteria bacterium]